MEFVQPIRDKKQLEAMKKILKATSLRDYCLFVLGINSGLRISDLLTLNVSDVINHQGKISDRITLREKKTNKTKDFPLGETTRKALKEYLDFIKIVLDQPFIPHQKRSTTYITSTSIQNLK